MRSVMKFQWTVGAALVWLAIPTTGWAQNFTYWQTNGGGCIPTDKTIREKQYWTVTGGGRVKYRGIGTRPLVFVCPVSNINHVSGGDFTVLNLFYQDPDGPGNAFSVEASLRSFAKANGALGQVCSVTSDTPGSWQRRASSGDCALDMDANFYWVEVVIRRTEASSLVVEFNGVELVSVFG